MAPPHTSRMHPRGGGREGVVVGGDGMRHARRWSRDEK
jgi:hypothetical protein